MTGDEPIDEEPGRTILVFVAVAAVVGIALVAAWFAMDTTTDGDASSTVAKGTTTTEPDATFASTTSSPAEAAATTTSTSSTTTTTAVPVSTGRFTSLPTSGAVHGTGTVHTYSIEVEEGSGVDPAEFASIVEYVLADPRGWVGKGDAFQRVPTGGSFTITLATPQTTDSICQPLDTAGKFSCHEGHRVVLNLKRWNEGTVDLPLSVDDYRAEVINHEVGHELGLGHVGCGGAGLKAPVMMQQSKGLNGCLANPWPMLDGT